MRLLALCSLLAVVSQPSLCERRNYATCSNDSGFECMDGMYCNIPAGQTVGSCMPNQCTTSNNTCPSAAPICSSGQCTKCQSDNDCGTLSQSTPLCDPSGICVTCKSNTDCTGATTPVCDTTTHSCRACQLHSECASGVCAKDNSFAGLSPTPIPQGSCASSSQVNVCDATHSIGMALGSVSPSAPYVLIKSLSTMAKVTIPALPSGLPTFYVIGPTADTAPSMLTTVSPLNLTYKAGPALYISPGTSAILEGMIITDSLTGLQCDSGSGMVATSVTLLRSFIGGIEGTGSVPIQSGPGCSLTLSSSWLGKGPAGTTLSGIGGNDYAMQLDGTALTMVNSVLWLDGKAGAFGGINIANTAPVTPAPLVRIVNSSFVDLSFSDSTSNRKVLALDCQYATNGNVSVVNTQFVNSTAPSGLTFVHLNCRPNNNSGLVGVASDDTALTGPTNITNVNDNILANAAVGDLHFGSNAPASVTNGGVLSFSDSQGAVPIPTVDIEGTPRGPGQISIGAFEVKR